MVQTLTQKGRTPKAWHATSDYLLTGLVVCGYCGAACSGGVDGLPGAWGSRKAPWRYYVCGNQKRKGWATCQLGKIKADGLEQAVVEQVFDQVLTRDYLEGRPERRLAAYELDDEGQPTERLGYLPKDAPRQTGSYLATLHRPEGKKRIEGDLCALRSYEETTSGRQGPG